MTVTIFLNDSSFAWSRASLLTVASVLEQDEHRRTSKLQLIDFTSLVMVTALFSRCVLCVLCVVNDLRTITFRGYLAVALQTLFRFPVTRSVPVFWPPNITMCAYGVSC